MSKTLRKPNLRAALRPVLITALAAGLAACAGGPSSGSTAFDRKSPNGAKVENMGVNAFLWRASLDTLSFLPLRNADPFGGTIVSDWYSEPGTPNERVRVTVYILDRRLRADALKLSVFREQRGKNGWRAVAIGREFVIALENTILTRASDLKSRYGQ